jgi:hypothetical protein
MHLEHVNTLMANWPPPHSQISSISNISLASRARTDSQGNPSGRGTAAAHSSLATVLFRTAEAYIGQSKPTDPPASSDPMTRPTETQFPSKVSWTVGRLQRRRSPTNTRPTAASRMSKHFQPGRVGPSTFHTRRSKRCHSETDRPMLSVRRPHPHPHLMSRPLIHAWRKQPRRPEFRPRLGQGVVLVLLWRHH